MPERLKGRRVLVSGAGSPSHGVSNGMACSLAYAREGAEVFLVDMSRDALNVTLDGLKSEGLTGTVHIADMTDAEAVADAVRSCEERLGGIDILHNNVGLATAGGPVETTEEDWDRFIRINVTTAFLTCKYALPGMIRAGSGVITNISSVGSKAWGGDTYISYSGGKAALNQLTRAVAVENAAKGIRCNAILPGYIATPFALAAPSIVRTSKKLDPNEKIKTEAVPLGYFGSPWDIASAAVFLASDDASFITGELLDIDGGMSNTIASAHPAGRAAK